MGMGNGFGVLARGLAITGAFALAACGNDNNGGSMIVPPGYGTLNVSLTDNPACGLDHVFVTVSKVRVNTDPNASPTASTWTDITVPSTVGKIDLLSLTNGVLQTLGQGSVGMGTYQQIRLVLAPNSGGTLANSAVPTGGTEQAMDPADAALNGIAISTSITVQTNTQTNLALDFDACQSVVQLGNGTFALKPVVTAIPMATSAGISGIVAGAPGAMVYAETGGGSVIKTTVAASDGSFTLAPIDTNLAGTVDVVVVPVAASGLATGVVRNVPLTAGTVLPIATAAAPISLPTSVSRSVSGAVTPASAAPTITALQSIGGRTYYIASTNAATDTGTYGLYRSQPALPSGTPVFGTYQTTFPIPLSQDFGATGQFVIQAQSSTGAITNTVDLRSGNLVNFDFSF